jgi:hypothetical protein
MARLALARLFEVPGLTWGRSASERAIARGMPPAIAALHTASLARHLSRARSATTISTAKPRPRRPAVEGRAVPREIPDPSHSTVIVRGRGWGRRRGVRRRAWSVVACVYGTKGPTLGHGSSTTCTCDADAQGRSIGASLVRRSVARWNVATAPPAPVSICGSSTAIHHAAPASYDAPARPRCGKADVLGPAGRLAGSPCAATWGCRVVS